MIPRRRTCPHYTTAGMSAGGGRGVAGVQFPTTAGVTFVVMAACYPAYESRCGSDLMPRWRPFEPYFWSLTEPEPNSGCWLWLGNVCKGYGRVHYNGRRQAAHRVSYELTYGPPGEHFFVCHRCDNTHCVNPQHLFLGTQKDNMQDWARKGKNVLANDPSLWSGGVHMKRPEYRQLAANRQIRRFQNGTITSVRDIQTGRILGTRRV